VRQPAPASPPATLLVTGAGGFVGAAVVRAALADGHRVIALGRTPGPSRLAGLKGDFVFEAVDLADRASMAAIVGRAGADCVIHCAWEGVGGPKRAGDIQLDNITTTCALVDATIAAGATKFVGIGSQAEYGRFDRRITESDLPAPTMLYGAAKLAACHLARQRSITGGMAFAWMRLFSTYGPGDNPNWLIPHVIAELVAGRRPRLTAGTQAWDYLHVDDVARAIVAVASGPAEGIFNLSSGQAVPVRRIVEQLRDIAAPGRELVFGEIAFGPDQIMHLEGDNSRLRAATGWAPSRALRDGLAQTVTAARAQVAA
jgi:nucleoside-diphosphate-sugar epimerase